MKVLFSFSINVSYSLTFTSPKIILKLPIIDNLVASQRIIINTRKISFQDKKIHFKKRKLHGNIKRKIEMKLRNYDLLI